LVTDIDLCLKQWVLKKISASLFGVVPHVNIDRIPTACLFYINTGRVSEKGLSHGLAIVPDRGQTFS